VNSGEQRRWGRCFSPSFSSWITMIDILHSVHFLDQDTITDFLIWSDIRN
jgi:hypothetical protein